MNRAISARARTRYKSIGPDPFHAFMPIVGSLNNALAPKYTRGSHTRQEVILALSQAGGPKLKTAWKDPDFDPDVCAFYHFRVLENLTCRWSTWDTVRADVKPCPNLEAMIQERAWSYPIWYVPTIGRNK